MAALRENGRCAASASSGAGKRPGLARAGFHIRGRLQAIGELPQASLRCNCMGAPPILLITERVSNPIPFPRHILSPATPTSSDGAGTVSSTVLRLLPRICCCRE